MSNNQRKLMPYEHQLVEALGITKEEYLEFVAQQQFYSDIKEGTLFDIRNPGIDWVVVSIVLTIVGTILQVAAALLAEQPGGGGQRQQKRDNVYAPRSGFNSAQELAKYGDPVNLIYTNKDVNPNGGVRVATSLVWSAVKSFGSSQYVQLLFVLGGGGIGRLDYTRTAFGQTPIRDLIDQNYWLYFDPYGTGPLAADNRVAGGTKNSDPSAGGLTYQNIYRIFPDAGETGDGFSHVISPSTANIFGVYGPVPINIDIIIRSSSGSQKSANSQIRISGLPMWGPTDNFSANKVIPEGEIFNVTIASTKTELDSNLIAEQEAQEHRRSLAPIFDTSSIFKLGSAKVKLIGVSGGSPSPDEGDFIATFQCIETGRAPSVFYAVTSMETAGLAIEYSPKYEILDRQVQDLLREDGRVSIGTAEELLKDGKIFTVSYTKSLITQTYKRDLTADEKNNLSEYIALEQQINSAQSDLKFFTKALTKIETASYETLSPCHIVDFALKAKVFRRISGRQEKYGTKEKKGYPVNDNGLKMRSAMFLLKYKTSTDLDFNYVKAIFVVRRAADVENYLSIRFQSPGFGLAAAKNWQFEFEPVFDVPAEIAKHGSKLQYNGMTRFLYLENSENKRTFTLDDSNKIIFNGFIQDSTNQFPGLNKSPKDTNEWDLFSNTADTQLQFSFDGGPELVITAVTEQIREKFNTVSPEGLYNDLSTVGLNLYSGRSVQDLRSVTMFADLGRRSRLLRTSGVIDGIAWGQQGFSYLPDKAERLANALQAGTSYFITDLGNTNWQAAGFPADQTPRLGRVFKAINSGNGNGKVRAGGHANTAPDIFLDTFLDLNDGIGHYAGDLFSIDIVQLAKSKKFCETNKLFMDGIIAEPTAWRQFWADYAPYSLLELAKTDGKESLVPGVPYDEQTGKILDASLLSAGKIKISALFNQGNILQDSYKEEFVDYGSSNEDIIATIIYRDSEKQEVFPRNNSVEIRLTDTSEQTGLRETIDASNFVTQRDQAILLGKFLCQSRRHSRRAIEFKTFPTDSYIAPGVYIYVELAQNQWNNIYSGIIGEDGLLNLPLSDVLQDGSYQFLMYNPNEQTQGVSFMNAVPVVNKTASSLKDYRGYVFVLGQAISNKRVFRVTEVAMDEEGETTIRGVEHPVNSDGYSRITRGLATKVPGLFTIDGLTE